MFGGHPLSHNPGRTPQVAMIHKFRNGESTEKQHVLLFARAAQRGDRNSNRRDSVLSPRSQVEVSRMLNRNKIKTINDGLKLAFLPRLSIQKLLHFCHIERKILSIAIT
jgi:hypothetical protein